jgi:Ala-tRNA(Pro) deacylase
LRTHSLTARWALCPPSETSIEVPVYVEAALAEDETIVFRAGTHTDTMSVSYADFERLVEPTIAEFAASRLG